MTKNRKREFHCVVVNEAVEIHLCKKSLQGLRSKNEFFVQCNQKECQYVDENKLPCPLVLSMFEGEIRERDEKTQQNRQTSEYY